MTASDARMWTIGELRAVLHHPVIGDNAEMRGYIQQTISEYQEGVSLLQGENSRKCKLLTAAWSPCLHLEQTGGGRLSTGRVLQDLCRKRGDTDTEEH